MNVLLLNDTTKWYHFGCTATSVALINSIKKLGYMVTTVPITEIYQIKYAPTTQQAFMCKNSYNHFTDNNYNLINLVKNHDIIVFNGEGTLHGISQAPLNILYLAYIAKKELGKHVEIINHSAYPEHDIHSRNSIEASIYKLVYGVVDFVAIREPISSKIMRNLGVHVNDSFDCMPLYIRSNYIKTNTKHTKEIIIAGSAAWLLFDLPSSRKSNINDFTSGLYEFNRYLLTMIEMGFKIKFLCGAVQYPAKDDKEFISYMQNHFKVKWEIYTATTVNDWLKAIEEATLLISGRFHHTIAAYCLNTKFIALGSNTPKIEGLLQILGREKIINYNDPNIYRRLIESSNKNLFSNVTTFYYDINKLCIMAEENFSKLKLLIPNTP